MESLESKLDRLSPDQRREVEDFVEFLLSRSSTPQIVPPASVIPPATPAVPPVMAPAAPPVLSVQEPQPLPPQHLAEPPEPAEPVITEITAGGDDWATREYLDYGKFEETQPSPADEAVKKVKRKLITKGEEEKPRQILDWID